MGRQRTLVAGVVGLVVLLLLGWYLTRPGETTTALPTTRVTSATTGTATGVRTAATQRTGSTTADSRATATPARATTGAVDPASGLPYVDVAALPVEAARTLALIDKGGPYPYPGKDGSTYRNLNGLLPRKPDGYYREYTVPTPGERDRGARRIVLGRGGELYWTADHYDSFARIRR